MKELGKKTPSPFFSVFLSYLRPLTRIEFNHLIPPLATVRGLRVGDTPKSQPALTQASPVEDNLAPHIAPEHTLAAICHHTLLLEGIPAGGPVTEPKMRAKPVLRDIAAFFFFARSWCLMHRKFKSNNRNIHWERSFQSSTLPTLLQKRSLSSDRKRSLSFRCTRVQTKFHIHIVE